MLGSPCLGTCQLEDDVDVCPFFSSVLVHIGSLRDQRMLCSEDDWAREIGELLVEEQARRGEEKSSNAKQTENALFGQL